VCSARLNPDLADRYAEVERRIGHRFRTDLTMADVNRRSTRRRPARADPSRRNRLAAIPARSTRPTHNPSLRIRPATTTKPDLVPNEARPECASEQTQFDAEQRIGIPHAALDGLAQRHRTRPPRLAPQPTNRRPTASAPHPRHAPHVVALRTSHHVLTQRPRPTHFDAHRVGAFMQREHVRTQSRSGGQRQRIYRLGRTHNPMPARVMKKGLAKSTYSDCALFLPPKVRVSTSTVITSVSPLRQGISIRRLAGLSTLGSFRNEFGI
jgi:hypothetical protein